MEIFIGVDGGGTKTEATAIFGNGDILSRYAGGPTNPYIVTLDTALEELHYIVDQIIAPLTNKSYICSSICLGMSGISSVKERLQVQQSLQSYFNTRQLRIPIYMRSEAEISLMAAMERQHGMLVISGTGSNTYGITKSGDIHRVGGWGHILGDEGSGYRIGLQTLQTVIKSHEGIIPPTLLTKLILAAYPVQVIPDLKSFIYQPSITKQHIASFARCCIEAAEAGDSAAIHIMEQQATELANTTDALIKQHPEFPMGEVVCVGSIFKHSRVFRDQYRRTMTSRYPSLQFPDRNSERTPSHGAALLACKLFTDGVSDSL
ncbi:N-acetylglucosamine kinase [Paenibacillus sp. JCM 10914]|uniref:BadF/BadG/BcrA/BcrD ATPase family protein n=1 Tax=Paenibacillus sp. JCM 10914 TaxID=1236974 RepID=UPI0003CC757B|nr:BadF/BadG/BcrA/BcrD ATPase family protein [Paenibacillus sp. JCM 10914]GAE09036.1 kinase similar to eukaryotic-like N-acetylglucosamine kinase [Paenibacillus sp. JCM 10914]